MTTVTLGDPEKFEKARVAAGMKPSEQAVAKAAAAYQITDARGRVITLKKPPVLNQFRLIEMLGDTASNTAYVSMVLPLIFVAEIDGEPPVVSTKLQLEALIQRLDQDGINAILKGVQENFGQTDPEADREALKK